MIHQFRDKKQIENRKKIIRNVIGFGVFFLLSITGVMIWSGNIFSNIGNPIWKTEKFIGKSINNFSYVFQTKKSLLNDNNDKTKENLDLKLSMIDYQILKKENQDLKEILDRISPVEDFILGNILTKPNHSPYDTIVIDLGGDKIKEGDLVYANGNIPIGLIDKVYDKNSLVTLYTNPSQKTEGFVDGSNASVELVGRGGGNFEMIVPMDLIIEKGSIIFLPGGESKILAIVDETISKSTDPFRKIILSSPVNIQNLKWVQVKRD
jgi:cell shape-determining protein MreC